MRTAALSAGWGRKNKGTSAPFGSGASGVSFIPELPDSRVTLEVAWGADLTANSDTWSWTDITTDVRADPGISCRLGRNDESSSANPAELTVVLTNSSGDYSLGGRSRRYPYVRRNTPVRVRIDPGTGARTVFFGYSTSWSPSWDSLTGQIPVVNLNASGTLRRLSQGAEPVISPVRRYLTNEPNVVAYWPCEDGRNAAQIVSGIDGPGMTFDTEVPDFAAVDTFIGSQPILDPKLSTLTGTVPTYTLSSDNSQSVRALVSFPEAGTISDLSYILEVHTSGSVAMFRLVYGTGGTLGIRAYDVNGVQVYNTGQVAFLVDGKQRLLSLEMFESGSDVHFGLNSLQTGETFYVSISGDPNTPGTVDLIKKIVVSPFAEVGGIGIGHIAVLNSRSNVDPLTDTYLQLNAYPGESITSDRLTRLCSENDIEFTLYGGPPDSTSPVDKAGPQSIDTLVSILRECEAAERGVLWDGLSAGLAYSTRRRHENRTADLVIDAGALQLGRDFEVIDDDQRTRNRVSVTRSGGSEFTYEDTDSTAAVGTYSDSLTVNSSTDNAAQSIAAWLVHAGTVGGYRYPSVTVDLRAAPTLAYSIVDLLPGSRVDITNLDTLSTSAPETVSLTVEGISHSIGPKHWTVTLTCSPFDVWRIDTLAEESGDVSEFVTRLDTDGSALAADYAVGSTSLVVNVPSGPLWTTSADDYPLLLDVSGVQVRATACSGASSPQTFTVDALDTTRFVGNSVNVWAPPALGL